MRGWFWINLGSKKRYNLELLSNRVCPKLCQVPIGTACIKRGVMERKCPSSLGSR